MKKKSTCKLAIKKNNPMSLKALNLLLIFQLVSFFASAQIFPNQPVNANPGFPDAIVAVSGAISGGVFMTATAEACIQGDDINGNGPGDDPEWRFDISIPTGMGPITPSCSPIEMRVCRRGDFGHLTEGVFVYDENLTQIGFIPGHSTNNGSFDCNNSPVCTIITVDPCAFNEQVTDGIWSVTLFTSGAIGGNTVGDFCNLIGGNQADGEPSTCIGNCPTYTQSVGGVFSDQAAGGPLVDNNCTGCNCAFIDYLKMNVAISDTSFTMSAAVGGAVGQPITLMPAPVTCPQAWTVNGGTTGLGATSGTTTFTASSAGTYTICNLVGDGICEGPNCKTLTIANEICDNGIDDDFDGLVDCNDPDCGSTTACEVCYDEVPNDTFFINTVPGATVYTWTIPDGAVLVSQPADTMIIVDMTGSYPHVDSICIVASDATCGKDSICYYLNMIFCNDPPIAVNDTTSTNEDIAVIIPVYGNDSDPEGNLQDNTSNVTGLPTPSNGSVSVDALTGDLTYTPDLNFNGLDSFQYIICDSLSLCDTAWVFVNIAPVNDPPVADGDTDTTNEDTNVTITVSTNDVDLDGNLNISTTNVTCTICTSPSNGALTNNGDGTFDYLPNADYNGSDSFIYEVCDTDNLCDTAIVNIIIIPVNDPPTANLDRDTTDEDVLVNVSVNPNDTDLENNIDPTTAKNTCMVCTGPSNGTLANNNDGTFDYTPSTNYNGTDNFIYEICDTDGLCDTAVVYLVILPVNDPPVANTDSESGNEDTNIPITTSSNDTDLDGNLDPNSTNVTCPVCTNPTNGTLTNNGDGTFNYLPNLNYNGTDNFIYEICDTDNLCDTTVVNLTIIPVNDPPVANVDRETTLEGTPVLVVSSSNDTDIELNLDPTTADLACLVCTNPSDGSVTNNNDGTFTYTPNPYFYGNDNFIYQICDTDGLCDTAVVYITVDPVNDQPLATDDITATPEDIPVAIDVLNNDSDPNDPIGNIDPTAVSQVVAPLDGSISIDPVTGVITYTPDPDFTGIDAFQYEVCDDGFPLPPLCDTAVVTVVVSPVNDSPVANEDNEITDEDVPVTISADANDVDVDGNLVPASANNICTVCTSPFNGSIVNNGDGTFDYTPNPNYFGTDNFIYEICDDDNLCDTAIVNITINSVLDPPVANDDLNATLEDVSITTPVVSNDTDGDGNLDPTTVTIIDDVNNGTTVVSPITGDITYVPTANFNGQDTLTYVICDTDNLCDTADLVLTIVPTVDPPLAVDDGGTTPEETPITTDVLANDSDADGDLDTSSVNVVSAPTNGTTSVNPLTGEITYTPDPAFYGTDMYTYEICDMTSPTPNCDLADVTISVTAENDKPVANDDSETTPEDVAVLIDILANDNDNLDPTADIDPTTVTIITPVSNGSTSINPTTGEVTYTPDPNFNGTDFFEYYVCDDGFPLPAKCDTARVDLTITPVNDPPVAVDDVNVTNEESSVTTIVSGNDTDEDGNLDPTTVTIISNATNGTGTPNGSGGIIYTPATDFAGQDTLTYRICDTDNLCDTADLVITVLPVTDGVIASDDSDTTPEDTPVTINVLLNDNDPDGDIDTSSVVVTTPPNNGSTSVNPLTGEITYMPNPNFNGTDSYSYEVCDLTSPTPNCDIATVFVTITPTNDKPLAVDDAETTTEETPVAIDLTANDNDDDDPLGNIDPTSVTIISGVANGMTALNPTTGVVTYTPDADFYGNDTFTYVVCDDGNPLPALCDTAEVVITVTPGNDSPMAVDDSAMTDEETPVTVDVASNDTDPNDPLGNIDPTSVGIITPPTNGITSINPTTGEITYTPNTDFVGNDTLEYVICDDGNPLPAQCDTAMVTFTVNPINDQPLAVDDNASTPEDTPVDIDVAMNDTDPNDPLGNIDPLSTQVVTNPANGTASVNPDGSINYDPDPNFVGLDSLEYRICDDGNPLPSQCDTAKVYINVSDVNDPPLAVNDRDTTLEDTPIAVDLPFNDTDADGTIDLTSVTEITPPANGSVSINAATGVATYTPDPDFNGTDVFEYAICDDDAQCDTATVTIVVNPVNDPPVAIDDVNFTNEEVAVTTNVSTNDMDVDGNLDIASIRIIAPTNNGTSVVNPGTDEIIYQPNANFNGADTLTYVICDTDYPAPTGGCDTADVIINVLPLVDPPVAQDDSDSTPEDTAVTTAVLNNDFDPDSDIDTSSLIILSPPTNGTAVVNTVTGEVTYTPDPNFNGNDSYLYQICDETMPLPNCVTATNFISVTPVNDPPVATDDMIVGTEDMPVDIDILANDNDPNDPAGDIDPTSVIILEFPTDGTVSVDAGTGELTYTPDAGFNGNDTLTYIVCDDGNPLPALCDTAQVIITIDGQNDPPLATNDTGTTDEDTPVTVDVASNDDDPNDPNGNIDPTTVGIVDAPTNGTVTINPITGEITYTPDPNFNGSDTLTYSICDDGFPLPAQCDTAQLILTVNDVNDPPVAVNDTTTVDEDMSIVIDVPTNDSDLDGMVILTSVTEVTPPSNGSTSIDPISGEITYTPNPDFNGTDVFEYAICDDDGACDTAQVVVNVTPVNDPPIAVDDSNTTNEESTVSTNILGNDTDVDGNLDPTSVRVLDDFENGLSTVDPTTGAVTYTPDTNFNGQDTLTYIVCDTDYPAPAGGCDTADLVITVLMVTDGVVASDDFDNTLEDMPVTTSVLNNDNDPDNDIDTSSVLVVSMPTNGSTSVNPLTGDITYTPNPNFNGTDNYSYQVCDLTSPTPNCDIATVFVTINPVNDKPLATDDSENTTEQTPVAIDLIANDNDDLDPLGNIDPTSVAIIDDATNGTTSVDPLTGVVTYTPDANFHGSDTLTYVVCDDGNPLPALCDTAEVIITVDPQNDPPVAVDDSAITDEETPVTVDVVNNDTDPNDPSGGIDPTSVGIITPPTNGTTVINPTTGEITYTPNTDFVGNDTLEYVVCDLGNPLPAECDTAQIVFTVNPLNDQPLAVNDTTMTTEDMPIDIDVASNDNDDADALGNIDPLSTQVVTNAANGTATVNLDGTINYDPDPNFVGLDSLTYSICDDGNPLPSQCDTATVYINVTDVNDPPVADNDAATTDEDLPTVIDVVNGDTDLDGTIDSTSVAIITPPTDGMVSIDPVTGEITYTPNPDFNGTDSFDYVVCDNDNACDTATVSITVDPVNDKPVAIDDTNVTNEDVAVSTNVSLNDLDVDSNLDPNTVTIITPPSNGTTSTTGGGNINYVPALNFNGKDTVEYRICDADYPAPTGGCDTAILVITVLPIVDPVVTVNDADTTFEDLPIVTTILDNDFDPDFDIDTSSLTIMSAPTNGTATPNPITGEIIYTPNPDFNGTDSYTYQVCDETMPVPNCDDATVFITVNPVNDPPIATDDSGNTPEDTQLVVDILNNDNDDADPSGGIDATSVNILDDVNNGTTSIDPLTGVVTYDPTPGFNGLDTLIYEVCDLGNPLPALCDTAMLIINVNADNDPPLAGDDTGTTDEDTPVTVDVLANDDDPNDPNGNIDPTSVGIVDAPTDGTVVINPTTGAITYTPDPNFNGSDTLTYVVCDDGFPLPAQCDTAQLILTINDVNDPPLAVNDTTTIDEDVAGLISLPANDFDLDGTIDLTSVTEITPPTNGSVSIDAVTGVATYTPNPDFNGVDQFEYAICDNDGMCDTALVIVNVTPVNDPPVAIDDANTTNEEVTVTTNIVGNDMDVDGNLDPTSVTVLDDFENGLSTIDPTTGAVSYTPNTNYNGQDTLTYIICDTDYPAPAGGCDTADLVITVLPVTDGVVASDDFDTTQEDMPVTTSVLNNDVDPDNDIDTMSILVVSMPSNGSTSVDPLTGEITYTPDPDFNGTDNYSYRVCDQTMPTPNCDIATVFITVNPVNDPPLAVDDTANATEEQPLPINVTGNDSDPTDPSGNVDPTTVVIITDVTDGTTSVDPITGVITYTSDPDFVGNDTLIYVICDDGNPLPALCDTAEVVITVGPVNDPPVAVDDSAITDEETPVKVDVVNNDTDPNDPSGGIDPTSVGIVTPPMNGTTVVDPVTGEITYTPDTDFVGNDTLEYVVCDLGNPLPAACDTAQIVFTVNPVNDPPIAIDDNVMVAEDTPIDIDVAANDTDANDPLGNIDPLSTQVVTNATNGNATVNPNGTVNYVPNPDFVGLDSLTYSICDDGNPLPAKCDTATIYIDVTQVNDPPVAVNDLDTTNEDSPVVIDVLANDFDIDGTLNPLSVAEVTPPTNGSILVNPTTGEITYEPNADFNGTDTFEYVVCDNDAACDTASVTVTVNPVNDPPVAVDDSNNVNEDDAVTTDVASNDFDIDGNLDPSSVTIISPASNGTANVTGVGNINYIPTANFNGMDTVEYRICDTGGLCDTAILVLNVLPQVDPPVALNNLDTMLEDNSVVTNVLDNDFDPDFDIDTSSVTVLSPPTNGTTSVNPLTGEITYTPNPDFNGTDSYVYQVCDETMPVPNCADATVFLTVDPVNDPPIATDDLIAGDEDMPIDIDILANDNDNKDPLGNIDPTSVTILENPTNGTVVVNPTTGELTYDPNPGFNGSDTLTYIVCDDGNPLPAQCDTAQVVMNIGAENDPPIAVNDRDTTLEDTPLVIDVAANDEDINDPIGNIDPTTVTILTDVNHGSTVVDPITGEITYTPDPNYFGTDTLTYLICDDGHPLPATCDTAEVYLVIDPVNDPPIGINDFNNTLVNYPVSGKEIRNDFDPEDDNIIINLTPIEMPTNGSVVLDATGRYVYTPNPGYAGFDEFKYEICDDGIPSGCDTVLVKIEMIELSQTDNNPPIANNDNYQTTIDDAIIGGDLISNDGDPDGDNVAINVTPVSNPTNGSLTIYPDGTFDYTPTPGFVGSDDFDYVICDDGTPMECDTATVFIEVMANPMDLNYTFATDDAAIFEEDTPATGNVLANDNDPDSDTQTATVNLIEMPLFGTVAMMPTGDFVYTPANGFIGNDEFVYEVCDNGTPIACDTATVYLTAMPVNDPPVGVDDVNQTLVDTPTSGNVLTNDNDPEGDDLAVSTTPVTNPTNGMVIIDSDGNYTYTPDPSFVGEDVFEYQVCDDGIPQACDTVEVSINIIDNSSLDNNPPIATDDNFQTTENNQVAGSLISNDNDPDADPISLTQISVSNPSNGILTFATDGTFTYIPDSGFVGEDVFEYEICDNGTPNLCDTAEVTINVLSNLAGDNVTFATDDAAVTNEDTPTTGNVLANDTDPESDSQTASTILVSLPANGEATLAANGDFTYTPDPEFGGNDQFVYEVCDNGSPVACDTATVYLTTLPVNDPPVGIDDINNTLVNVPVEGNVLLNDFDPEGDDLKIDPTPVTAPTNGTVAIDPLGNYTYSPATDFTGEDSFEYEVCDNGSPVECDTVLVSIEVIDISNLDNNPPIAQNDNYTSLQDVTLDGNVISNDGDPDGDNIVVSNIPVSNPNNGTVNISANGTFMYIPNPDFTGTDAFEYEICDDGMPSKCDTATVVVEILPDDNVVNSTFATDDAMMFDEDTPLTANVSANDNDPEGDNQVVKTILIENPTNGSISMNANGEFTYTPNAEFNGNDQFVYEVCDTGSPIVCDTATVYLTTLPQNDSPIATDDTGTVDEDTPVTIDVANNDTDPNDPLGNIDPTTVGVITPPTNGATTIDPVTGEITYTPDPDFVGTDSLQYVICDDGYPLPAQCDSAWIVINVTPVNDPPVFVDDMDNPLDTIYATLPEDGSDTTCVSVTDADLSNGTEMLTCSILTLPSNGTATVDGDTCVVYTPIANFNGIDSLVKLVCDNAGECDTLVVYYEVTPSNDPPIATDDTGTVDEDTPVTIDVANNDTDPNDPLGNIDPTTVGVITPPTNGTTTIDPVTGEITYTPNPDFNGTDSLQYVICDDGYPLPAQCDSAWIVIEVNPVNDPPIGMNDINTTMIDEPVSGNVLTNDSDPNGDDLIVFGTPVTPPSNGTVTIDPDGNYTYTPNPGFVGTDVFEYQVCDTGVSPTECDTVGVTINVFEILDNDDNPPVANDDNFQTNTDTPVGGNVLTNDFDFDGDSLTVKNTPLVLPMNGSVLLGADGTFVYTPDPGFVGDDAFTYIVCDDSIPELCDTATVNITVYDNFGVNTTYAVDDIGNLSEDTQFTSNALTNDYDLEGDNQQIITLLVEQPSNGSVSMQLNGDYIYTPALNYHGNDEFVYAVCDDGSPITCDTATVYLTILPTNDPIMAVNDTVSVDEDDTVLIDVMANDSDPLDPTGMLDSTSVQIVMNGTNGTATVDTLTGEITYVPNPDFFGMDTIVYSVCDDDVPALCDMAYVFIDVLPTPDRPIAMKDSSASFINQTDSIYVLLNDYDPDVEQIHIEGSGVNALNSMTNQGGILSVNDNGTSLDLTDDFIEYFPPNNFVGLDTFLYQIEDPTGRLDTAVVCLSVSIPMEDCSDGIDNDLDGLTDCDDPDCGFDAPVAIVGDCFFLKVFEPEIDWSYEWFRNGVLIAGETDPTYVPNPGTYAKFSVRVTNGNGCISTSAEVEACCAPTKLSIGDR